MLGAFKGAHCSPLKSLARSSDNAAHGKKQESDEHIGLKRLPLPERVTKRHFGGGNQIMQPHQHDQRGVLEPTDRGIGERRCCCSDHLREYDKPPEPRVYRPRRRRCIMGARECHAAATDGLSWNQEAAPVVMRPVDRNLKSIKPNDQGATLGAGRPHPIINTQSLLKAAYESCLEQHCHR
jgi:hypothetical protein